MTKEEYIEIAIDTMKKGDADAAAANMNNAIADGIDPAELLSEGYSAGIREVGDLFGKGRMFLPELMLAADAIVTERFGKPLLFSGKGIVASLIKTQGVDVIDLGRDVPAAEIVDKAVELDADLIGTSALLTTTMGEMKVLEDLLKKRGLKDRFKTLVGGAPVTERFAKRIGADAYGEDASEAVSAVVRLLG